MKDLKERFAKIDIQSSSPIVPFRETIVAASEMAPPKDANLPRGTVNAITPSKQITVRLRTRPLPPAVTKFLVENSSAIKSLYSVRRGKEEGADEHGAATGQSKDGGNRAQAKVKLVGAGQIRQGLLQAFETAPPKERDTWAGVVDKIIAFGPRRIGPNVLIDATPECGFRRLCVDVSAPLVGTLANQLHKAVRQSGCRQRALGGALCA